MILRSQFKRLAIRIAIVHRGVSSDFQLPGFGAVEQCLEQEDRCRFAGAVILAHNLFMSCLPSLVSEIDKIFFQGIASFSNLNCLTGKGHTQNKTEGGGLNVTEWPC